jgi:cation diffusion facilitator family transporter
MSVERWGWLSIGVNVLLIGLHAIVAAASGSLAVTAELTHNVVDLLTAVAVLAGLRIAARKSRAFPYGLYKVENVVAAGLAIMVFVSAWEIARHAVWAPVVPVRVDVWMLGLLLVTGVIPLVFAHFELRAGKAARSPALIADAREYQVHVYTTGLAFAALLAQALSFPLDRIAALLIVAAVLRTGWGLLRDAMRVLLDASVDAKTLDVVRERILADPAVAEIRWMTGRNAGQFCFVEVGVALRVAETGKVESVVQRIETAVRGAVPQMERVLLHVEAPASPVLRYAVPLSDISGTVSDHFGEAPWFAFVSLRRAEHTLEETRVIANPHVDAPRAKGIRVAEWLIASKVDVVVSREDLGGKGPTYVLRDGGVELRMTAGRTLPDVLAEFEEAHQR